MSEEEEKEKDAEQEDVQEQENDDTQLHNDVSGASSGNENDGSLKFEYLQSIRLEAFFPSIPNEAPSTSQAFRYDRKLDWSLSLPVRFR